MPTIATNGIELCYEDFGDRAAPVVLLVMGLGAQLIFWPETLVEGLVARGYRVIRYDNRDVGQSTHLGDRGPPSRLQYVAALLGLPAGMPYSLRDMARDAVGLLDALGIAKAHVVGASMGGIIAQIVAAEHSGRVLSLVSVMSTSGRRGLPGPSPTVRNMMLRRAPVASRDAAVAGGTRLYAAIGGPLDGRAPGQLAELLGRAYDRGFDPAGAARQLGAIIADGSRVARLRRIRVPTLVIHGDRDPLVPLAGGRDTALNIRGARLEVVAGMGHDLPPAVVGPVTELIATHLDAVAGR
ncbi:alpha/beta fold hydrolase [Sphingosinicellaceae bacterium]|nr:alpha/beta fold hydrolase [Sphingosinicellaceae bacterium]